MNEVYGSARCRGMSHPAYKDENGTIEICCSCPGTQSGALKANTFTANYPAACKPGQWHNAKWKELGYFN